MPGADAGPKADTPQPRGYTRDDAERRVAQALAAELPDSAMVTVFVGDLRELIAKLPD